MILEYRPSWIQILRQLMLPLTLFFFMAVAVVAIAHYHHYSVFSLPEQVLTLIGVGLTILLQFRINAAYARWWEARTLWGALVNNSRSLARQVISMTHAPEETQRDAAAFSEEIVYAQIGFVNALRCHLRFQDPLIEAQRLMGQRFADSLRSEKNVPAAILQHMGIRIGEAARKGLLTEFRQIALDRTLSELTNIQGGSERIRDTPFPRQYEFYLEGLVYVYCLTSPMALVDHTGIFTPVLTIGLALVFLILNRIGRDLENPFHNVIPGIPLSALTRTIEINLRQQLGETEVPPPLEPQDGILV